MVRCASACFPGLNQKANFTGPWAVRHGPGCVCHLALSGLSSARVQQNGISWLRRLGRLFRDWLLGVPVFVKVMGIALGMAALLGAGMLWQIHQTWHRHLISDLERRGEKFAEQLADHCHEFAQAGRAAELPSELQHSLADRPSLR